MHKNSQEWLEQYWKKLKCYDEIVNVHGNYNSVRVSHLHLKFARCNPTERATCKSDEEFREFTKKLYTVHVNNSVRFVQTGYGDKKLNKESRFTWTRVPKDNEGDEIFYEIHNKEIRLQDSRWQSSFANAEIVMAFDILKA